jgi:hypothetical protein
MPHPYYYLLNHTCREFCFFDNTKPILMIIEIALQKNTRWKSTDDIHIGCECKGNGLLLGYLVNQMEYVENAPF